MSGGNDPNRRKNVENPPNQPKGERQPPQQNVQGPPQDQPQGQAGYRQATPQNQPVGETLSQSFEPIKGAVVGAATYVVAYIGTFLLITFDSGADIETVTTEFGTSQMNVIGWIFYGAHYSDLEISAGTTLRSENILSGSTLAIPKVVYFAVPIVLLAIAGYIVASRSENYSTKASMIAGSSVVAGYLPLVFLGTYIFTTTVESQGVVVVYSISTGTAAILGALMAVILGGIGGYVAD